MKTEAQKAYLREWRQRNPKKLDRYNAERRELRNSKFVFAQKPMQIPANLLCSCGCGWRHNNAVSVVRKVVNAYGGYHFEVKWYANRVHKEKANG